MDDRELIAATLTAGMLPSMEIPQSRARGRAGGVTEVEGQEIQRPCDRPLPIRFRGAWGRPIRGPAGT